MWICHGALTELVELGYLNRIVMQADITILQSMLSFIENTKGSRHSKEPRK